MVEYFQSMSRSFIKAPGGVAERKIREQCILVPISSELAKLDSLYELNETSSFIWDIAKAGATEQEVVVALQESYDVTEEQAVESVSRSLDELVAAGALIEQADA